MLACSYLSWLLQHDTETFACVEHEQWFLSVMNSLILTLGLMQLNQRRSGCCHQFWWYSWHVFVADCRPYMKYRHFFSWLYSACCFVPHRTLRTQCNFTNTNHLIWFGARMLLCLSNSNYSNYSNYFCSYTAKINVVKRKETMMCSQ